MAPRARRILVAFLSVIAVGVVNAPSAAAHTALVASDPPSRTHVTTLDEVTLNFAEEVGFGTTSARVIDQEGEVVADLVEQPGNLPLVVFAVPALDEGLYGIVWETVGPDGHRVAGEVVVSVGSQAVSGLLDQSFSGADALDHVRVVLGFAGRIFTIVGAIAVAAGLFAAGTTATASGARYRLVGGTLVVVGLWLRMLVAVWARIDIGGSLSDALGQSIMWSSVAAMIAVWLVVQLGDRYEQTRQHRIALIGLGWVALFCACGFYALTGHAASVGTRSLDHVIAALHLTAAIAWLGPLVVLATGSRERQQLGEYSRAMVVVFPALIATGLYQNNVLNGLDWSTPFGRGVGAKVMVVVVAIVPLVLGHRLLLARRGELGPTALRWQLGVGLAVIVLAGVLPAMVPGKIARRAEADPVALVPIEAPESTDECREREIGRADCYLAYFTAVLETDGPEAAVTAIDQAQQEHPFVAENCHQLTHDVGRSAVEVTGSVGAAMAATASACFSGYYHGVVAVAIEQLDAVGAGRNLVPTLCDQPRDLGALNFRHFSCLHGVGHAIMLELAPTLEGSLAMCKAFAQTEEQQMCSSGVFMENVQQAFASSDPLTRFDPDDPVYPCTAVDSQFQVDCVLNHIPYWEQALGWSRSEQLAGCDLVKGLGPDVVFACWRAIGTETTGSVDGDPEGIVEVCDLGTGDARRGCVFGAAQDLIFFSGDPLAADDFCATLDGRDNEMAALCRQARDLASETL